jgi:hypothetical protein
MRSSNLDLIEIVARGLGPWIGDFLFVGGSVLELYRTAGGAGPVRPTIDVDCVLRVVDRTTMRGWEERLETLGFKHDTRQGAPICRWLFDGVQVDVMPTESAVFGFSNSWYRKGAVAPMAATLKGGVVIQLLAAPYYFASKLEAVRSRGWPDLRMSHDFEDIVYLWENRDELESEVANSEGKLRVFIAAQAGVFRANPVFREALEGHLSRGSAGKAEGILRAWSRLEAMSP